MLFSCAEGGTKDLPPVGLLRVSQSNAKARLNSAWIYNAYECMRVFRKRRHLMQWSIRSNSSLTYFKQILWIEFLNQNQMTNVLGKRKRALTFSSNPRLLVFEKADFSLWIFQKIPLIPWYLTSPVQSSTLNNLTGFLGQAKYGFEPNSITASENTPLSRCSLSHVSIPKSDESCPCAISGGFVVILGDEPTVMILDMSPRRIDFYHIWCMVRETSISFVRNGSEMDPAIHYL